MTEQHLHGIAGFHLVTTEWKRLAVFYRDALGFRLEGEPSAIPPDEMRLLELDGGGIRQALRLGEQLVFLDQFERPGRSYPAGGTAASSFFQHLALVAIDIRAAFERLRMVTPITRGGPVMLPHSSGGVSAYKFRDPDGHPLELLEFPDAHMPEHWRKREPDNAGSVLGIDHSAISVADPETSTRFYDGLGLEQAEGSLNHGPEQERLDGLPDVEVAVQPLRPPAGTPHLELLGYRRPASSGAAPWHPNDVAATRIAWHGADAALLRDPDGHLHQVLPAP